MADQDSVSAVLTINSDVQRKLEKAQQTLEKMAQASERLEVSFKRLHGEDIRAQMESIGKAVLLLSQQSMRAKGEELRVGLDANKQRLQSEETLNEKLQRIVARRITTYKQAESALTSLRSLEGQFQQLHSQGALSNNSALTDIRSLIKSLESFQKQVGLNAADARSAFDKAMSMPMGNIEQTVQRLNALKSAIAEMKKDGGTLSDRQWLLGNLPKANAELEITRRRLAELRSVDGVSRRIQNLNTNLLACSQNARALSGMLAQAFSPFLMAQFLRELIQVRGQFEMTERSLNVILGDAAKASEIFNTIQEISVRSPFAVKDLVGYTRQLAAFRIETDKLIETTQMLGDISAGVGVDMNRLILAYGQVKAAEYLKGTELRQFSEAGVNMLGGLADRFSEIYGRAVSVGEVFEMVSKRMVRFADVEAVLKRATSAGGAFYQMQARQADTLQGHIVNLRDRLDIMFNEIGSNYDGLMKSIVEGLEMILSHWKAVSAVIVPILASKMLTGAAGLLVGQFGKVSAALKNANGYISLVGSSMTTLGKTIVRMRSIVSAFGGWFNIISVSVIGVINLVRLLTSEQRELRDVVQRSDEQYSQSASRLQEMISIVTDINVREQLRRRTLEEIKAEYGNIIDLEGITLSNASLLNERQSQYLAMLREQQIIQTRQQAYQSAEKMLSRGRSQYAGGLSKLFEKFFSDEGWSNVLQDTDVQEAVLKRLEQGVFDGMLTSMEQVRDRYLQIVGDYVNIPAEQLSTLRKQLEGGYGAYLEYMLLVYDRFNDALGNTINLDYSVSTTPYRKMLDDFKKSYSSAFEDMLDEEKRAAYELNPAQRSLDFHKWMQQRVEEMIQAVREGELSEGWGELTEQMSDKLIKDIEAAARQIDPMYNAIESVLRHAAYKTYETFGQLVVDFEPGSDLYKSEQESIEEYYNRVIKLIEGYQRDLDILRSQADNSTKISTVSTWNADWQGLVPTTEDVAKATEAVSRNMEAAKYYLNEVKGLTVFITDPDKQSSLQSFIRTLTSAKEKLSDLTSQGRAQYVKYLEQLAESMHFKLDFDIQEVDQAELSRRIEEFISYLPPSINIPLYLEIEEKDTKRRIDEALKNARTLLNRYDTSEDLYQAGEAAIRPSITSLETSLNAIISSLREFDTTTSLEAASDLERELSRRKLSLRRDLRKEREDSLRDEENELKRLVSNVKSALSQFDKLDESGDKLLLSKLRRDASRYGIELPDVLDRSILEDIIQEVERRYGQEAALELKIELNEESVAQGISSIEEQMGRLWEKYESARKFEQWGVQLYSESSVEVLREIVELEERLRGMTGAEDAIRAADKQRERRLREARGQQEEAARIVYESQKGSLTGMQQAYQEMVEDVQKMLSSTLPQESIMNGVNARIVKGIQEVNKAQWEAYKSTEMYAVAFGDLDGLGVEVLKALRTQLESLSRSGLSPSDMKSISDRIRDIDYALSGIVSEGNGLGVVARGFRDIAQAARIQNEELPELQAQMVMYSQELESALRARDEADSRLLASSTAQEYEERLREQKRASEEVERATQRLSSATALLSERQRRANTLMESAPKRLEELGSRYDAVGKSIESVIDLVSESVDAFGGELSESTSAAIEGFTQGFGLVGSSISMVTSLMMGYKAITDAGIVSTATLQAMLGPIAVVGLAIGGVVAAIKSVDRGREQSIEEHRKAVEALTQAYDKLQERMQSSLTLSELVSSYGQSYAVLRGQVSQIQEAIAINDMRVQTREVRQETESLLQTLSELEDKQEELRRKRYEMLGSSSDYSNEASSWAESWLQSYMEVGSGLDSLQEGFDEFFNRLIARQVQYLTFGPSIQKLEQLVTSILRDTIISDEEVALLQEFRDHELSLLEQKAQMLMDSLGLSATGTRSDNTVSRGIESITETQASALEALMTSTRFSVESIDDSVNTMLSLVRSQGMHLEEIARLVSSVYYPGHHSRGPGAIKVVVD